MVASFNSQFDDVFGLLELKYEQYNSYNFIKNDPISLPHKFKKKQDIEIVAFLVAIISWGRRASIIKNGEQLIRIMENEPYHFVLNYQSSVLVNKKFVHRTFNSIDLDFIFRALQRCYREFDSMEAIFSLQKNEIGIKARIINFRNYIFQTSHEKRSEKHISNPDKGSAAKRINMFLRWMVRKDTCGVDFGLWNTISPAELYLPLDVHTGNVARKMGLLTRKQNDWKALEELMGKLQKMDADDPCKYDFALFGLGVTGEI